MGAGFDDVGAEGDAGDDGGGQAGRVLHIPIRGMAAWRRARWRISLRVREVLEQEGTAARSHEGITYPCSRPNLEVVYADPPAGTQRRARTTLNPPPLCRVSGYIKFRVAARRQ